VTDRRGWRVAFAGVVALSLVVLFSPTSGPSGIAVSDKLIHFLLFAALAVTGRLAGVPTLQLAIGLAGYAGLSEVLQAVLPIDRDGDVRDAVADVLGVLAGLTLVFVATRRSA
jgi:VanZ family protein